MSNISRDNTSQEQIRKIEVVSEENASKKEKGVTLDL